MDASVLAKPPVQREAPVRKVEGRNTPSAAQVCIEISDPDLRRICGVDAVALKNGGHEPAPQPANELVLARLDGKSLGNIPDVTISDVPINQEVATPIDPMVCRDVLGLMRECQRVGLFNQAARDSQPEAAAVR